MGRGHAFTCGNKVPNVGPVYPRDSLAQDLCHPVIIETISRACRRGYRDESRLCKPIGVESSPQLLSGYDDRSFFMPIFGSAPPINGLLQIGNKLVCAAVGVTTTSRILPQIVAIIVLSNMKMIASRQFVNLCETGRQGVFLCPRSHGPELHPSSGKSRAMSARDPGSSCQG